jgi:hypothetical protein
MGSCSCRALESGVRRYGGGGSDDDLVVRLHVSTPVVLVVTRRVGAAS